MHPVAQLCLVFCICGALPEADSFLAMLAYFQHYNPISQPSASAPTSHKGKIDPITSLYALKHTFQADKT